MDQVSKKMPLEITTFVLYFGKSDE